MWISNIFIFLSKIKNNVIEKMSSIIKIIVIYY